MISAWWLLLIIPFSASLGMFATCLLMAGNSRQIKKQGEFYANE